MTIDTRLWDVLVVGAGPSGACAARYAALHGLRVLAIDARREIGVPVQCGEYVTEIAEVRRLFPLAPDIDRLFDIPDALKLLPMTDCCVHAPSGRVVTTRLEGYGTCRKSFDQHLWALARAQGARLQLRTRATRVVIDDRDAVASVQTERGVFRARLVVLASGSLTKAAEWLGLDGPRENCPCIYTVARCAHGDKLHLYFGAVAPGGYAWVIPKGADQANIGLGVHPRFRAPCESLRPRFDAFLATVGVRDRESLRYRGGWVPMGGFVKRSYRQRVMLAGDAAGMVIPTNGGGITTAMIAGQLAGCTAADHLRHGVPVSEYERRWQWVLGAPLVYAKLARRLLDPLMGSDRTVELGIRLLGPRGVGSVISAQPVFPALFRRWPPRRPVALPRVVQPTPGWPGDAGTRPGAAGRD